MPISVGINPPKTPVTKGSDGIAKNTLPNVCKMPGPPAPFVPSPLPNIAKSGSSPKGYSTDVKVEGKTVAIRGATFESMGDVASKATGGGLISANTHGPAKFVAPGSMDVKIEGSNVQLLGDAMLNNCGPSGSPPNTGATMTGVCQAQQGGKNAIVIDCTKDDSGAPFSKCEQEEICAKCASVNALAQQGKLKKRKKSRAAAATAENSARSRYRRWAAAKTPPRAGLGFAAHSPKCLKEMQDEFDKNPPKGFSPDHIHDWTLNGPPSNSSNFRWMSQRTNGWMGSKMQNFQASGPNKNTGVKCTCCS